MREVWESLTYRWDRMNTPKEGGEREREKKKRTPELSLVYKT